MKAQFALLAEYLGKAQQVALKISRSNISNFAPTIPDLTPPQSIPSEDAWFWSEEWQAKEKEANEELARGEYVAFDNVNDALNYLHNA
ncbi:MAG: hypothetical protein AAFY41_18140 [Bacteroidota bacterium]